MSEPMRIGVMEGPEVEEEVPVAEPEVAEEQPAPPTPEELGEPAPTDELWPGGPTFAQIEEWKAQHGDVYVTSVTPDDHYVWRTITRFEYRRLVKNLEQSISTGQVTQAEANMNNEESITEMCVLFPPVTRAQLSGEMAGLSSIISQEVMEASGFVALEIRQL